MLENDEEYPSDSEQSDEDYKPDGNDSDLPSEIESDGDVENDVNDDDNEDNNAVAKQKSQKRKSSVNRSEKNQTSKRMKGVNEEEAKIDAKDASDREDDKQHTDALWASFLNKAATAAAPSKSTTPTTSKPSATLTSLSSSSGETTPTPVKATSNGGEAVNKNPNAEKTIEKPVHKKIVTEIFEFAGEKVEVKKVVETNLGQSTNESKAKINIPNRATAALPMNRARSSGGMGSSSGGISSILGQIGKKNKLSVLEKSKLDWNRFKSNEGIDEELQTHNKGRDGFLERQDFLQRTDFRRFEIEKNLRQVTRKK